ncbi:DUF2194 domain-containing protein [Paenibacillus sp. J5C_2022]|uniref:DUF2194 domain-containing protein n=1 Tax=Paenibacillus sp. J5C2022 TaxID=2977129 RepID=UPI0021CE1926|nr:DUF2194 domain-containing protein [Paenibacillus sp. J5C2022]MCU6710804.1 DUF2194 domain-containing protein [Paenibacillus sp. J5C2022]
MQNEQKFKRNIILILLFILTLGVVIQVARSQFVLRFNQNERFLEKYEALMSLKEQIGENTDYAMTDELYCVTYSEQIEQSIGIKDNAVRMLQYMKRDSLEVNVSQDAIDYGACTTVMLTTSKLSDIGDVTELLEFVYNGGSVFLMTMPTVDDSFHQVYRRLGITDFLYADEATGIELTSNVLIGEKGLRTGEDYLYNTSLYLELDNEATLLARSLEGIPLMWHRDYGQGRFLVYNGNMLHLKHSRGLIASGISMLQKEFIYPVFNSKLFYIDDFPAPYSRELEPVIYRQYGVDNPTFFRNVWWPDMLKAAKQYDVKYTAVLIQSYWEDVLPPYENPGDEEKHNLISYGREVIKSGGEIGIHGYNHQSLTVNEEVSREFGYDPWRSQEEMEAAVEVVLNYLEEAFPNYKALSYVPPSNVLGLEGRKALKAAWPELAVIASLYDTDFSGNAFVQEYELGDDGILDMPRITSGYFETSYNRWLEANTITSLGIMSHFLHPDDLLEETRGLNKTWTQLYEDFIGMLRRLDRTYPWLREMTSAEAGLDMARTLQAQVSAVFEDDQLRGEVAGYEAPLYFIMRTERQIKRQSHSTVQKIDDDIYLVKVTGPEFAIGLGG